MSESSRLVTLYSSRYSPLQFVAAVIVATILALFVAPFGTTRADSRQYSVVALVDAKSAGLTSRDIVVRVENVSAPATSIKASPDIPRNIAIVVDAGPDQANVLSKEKDLAITLINALSDANTSFAIANAATSSKTQATTLDRFVAIAQVRDITGDAGEKRNVAVYDAIGSAIRQVSLSPGLHVVVFIGEGNDSGSRMSYEELRNLAESNQIAFFVALVAGHSLRGTKSILRYGWKLQELTSDSVGMFFENPKPAKAARQLRGSVQGLRLVTFDTPSLLSGRYRISVSSQRRTRFKAQKAIVIP
jgi:hypothetical protein